MACESVIRVSISIAGRSVGMRRAAMLAAAPDKRRIGRWALGCASLAVALGVTLLAPPRPRLVWNASTSAPVGLYAVGDGASLARDDMVIARVPDQFRMFAARRRYLPANVPLVKRVAAAAGEDRKSTRLNSRP